MRGATGPIAAGGDGGRGSDHTVVGRPVEVRDRIVEVLDDVIWVVALEFVLIARGAPVLDLGLDADISRAERGLLDIGRVRVVGVRDEDADDYHLYITNLPREEFLPSDLATPYRCRWEVEMLLRGLKTQYELDVFDTSDPDVMKILLYAALLSLLVSRDLSDLVTGQTDDEIVFPPERWAATFRSHAPFIFHELGEYLGYSPPPLLERLI